MKAVQFSRTGGVEVLEHNDVPVPTPAEGHVLVRNRFGGVNFIDTYFRTGLYKAPSLPMTLGREAAGEVVAAHPSVSGPLATPGTRVVYMAPGSYAQYTSVPADKLSVVPDNVELDVAAAVLLQGLTALTLIREAAVVQPGQWTLVHAAAGGVGLLLVQMLRAVGAKVIGTASTEEKCALARKHGAEWTVNSHDDLVAKVKEITNGHGVDAIFDGVGKATFEADLQMIAMKGHLVSFGNAVCHTPGLIYPKKIQTFTPLSIINWFYYGLTNNPQSGAVPPISVLDLAPKNVKLMRPVVNGYVQDRADLDRYTNELFDMVASKKVEVLIHKVYNLSDAGSAHTDIESRKTTGKLIIKCD
jgi:NADPH2:quinone reductase